MAIAKNSPLEPRFRYYWVQNPGPVLMVQAFLNKKKSL